MIDINRIIFRLSYKPTILKSQMHLRDLMLEQLKFFGFDCGINIKIGNDSVDILAFDKVSSKKYLFEVRYKTKRLKINIEGMEYNLKNHGAQDQGRYDYIKDIEKLERLVDSRDNTEGFALMITNDHYYWEPPVKNESIDKDFLLYNGRTLNGHLKWGEHAAKGTMYNRETFIQIKRKYNIKWDEYVNYDSKNAKFNFLLVHVKGSNGIE
jgi:hypothetical protein